MAVKSHIVGEFVEKLYLSDELEKRFRIYEEAVRSLGFEAVTFAFAPNVELTGNLLTPVFLNSSPYPMGFLQQYNEEKLHMKDFTIRKITHQQLEPMDWREHEHSNSITNDEKRVIQIARNDHGIMNGISIPTMNKNIGMAGASVLSLEKDVSFNILKCENLETLVLCTYLFHNHLFAYNKIPHQFILSLLNSLKPVEIKILQYVASGKPFKNITHETGISRGYASNKLDNLRARLGGINKDKLLYLLGLLNILDDV